MCGEHRTGRPYFAIVQGSSPHVRGALLHLRVDARDRGIIPACAGSTHHESDGADDERDHPRMCGEHFQTKRARIRLSGSSPHVRGAPHLMAELRGQSGIIPACAGSTALISINSPVSRDHPRMCGEHAWRFECFLTHGDHPRMCGEHQRGVRDPRTALGSSPHVRGARLERDENPSGSGIIPACAGSTDRVGAAGSLVGDHPRMCGEHITPNPFANAVLGSSPHVRGALIQGIVLHCPLGIIPACAGSTASAATASDPRRDHPRMCGEHLVDGDRNRLGRGSSPHVRGARRPRQPGIRPNGIIPACAGSTQVRLRRRPWTEDHPRMCGEHRSGFNALFFLTGSSPHVRGARGRTSFPSRFQGIIPACAGSTGRGSCAWCPPRDHPRMCGEHSRSFPVTWTPQGSSPHVRGAPLYENLII